MILYHLTGNGNENEVLKICHPAPTICLYVALLSLQCNGNMEICMSIIRLFYIDDEPDIREIAVFSLEMDPELEIQSCESGQQALALIPQWEPDIILLNEAK